MYAGSLTLLPSQTVKGLPPFIGRWVDFWAFGLHVRARSPMKPKRETFSVPQRLNLGAYERKVY